MKARETAQIWHLEPAARHRQFVSAHSTLGARTMSEALAPRLMSDEPPPPQIDLSLEHGHLLIGLAKRISVAQSRQ